LSAVVAPLQTTARRNGIPIDSLVFEHGMVNLEEREINGPPKEGVYVKGLFLEGGCDALNNPFKCGCGVQCDDAVYGTP
jgi:dynein heavy chain